MKYTKRLIDIILSTHILKQIKIKANQIDNIYDIESSEKDFNREVLVDVSLRNEFKIIAKRTFF